MTEQEIRQQVQSQALFHKVSFGLIVANITFLGVYMVQGGGSFWPIYPIALSGVYLYLHAYRANIVPSYDSLNSFLERHFPAFRENWVEEEVQKRLSEVSSSSGTSSKKGRASS